MFTVEKTTMDLIKLLPHKFNKNSLDQIISQKSDAKIITGLTSLCFTHQAIIFSRVVAISRKKWEKISCYPKKEASRKANANSMPHWNFSNFPNPISHNSINSSALQALKFAQESTMISQPIWKKCDPDSFFENGPDNLYPMRSHISISWILKMKMKKTLKNVYNHESMVSFLFFLNYFIHIERT